MIDLTVKTLDSENHAFSVADDITVAQFKEHIADVINIPIDSQRLIYCGRVLQDTKKLQEYDVHGKVVHLVQRAPPSATRRTRSPQPPGNATRRPFPGFNGSTNTMYLGSMAFPSGLMEAQGIVPPPPTQSLSGSRLNVARRMLRQASNILNNLENPQGSQNREQAPEEPQEDVIPVFAAQVFVPDSSQDDPLASLTAAVSAVENNILHSEPQLAASGNETEVNGTEPASASAVTDAATDAPTGAPTDAPIDAPTNAPTDAPTDAPTENGAPEQTTTPAENENNNRTRSRRLPDNASGTIEMSRLLDDLNKVQERLRPFMERYHTFMRNDPALSNDEAPQMHTLINRVSQVMHLLGHAYHSLSDIIVQVYSPPPRPLFCHPILIQHSAVVQAGIPIQVEAQINVGERRPPEGAANPPPASERSPDAAQPAADREASQAPRQAQRGPSVHEIRIDSFPFDLRFPRTPVFNVTAQQPRAAQPPTTATGDTPTTVTETPASDQAQASQDPNVVVMPPFNPNMEFFMEVTPESITIDSLETTVVTSAAQADNVLRGTFGSAPPEFIQSILQAVAGQMMANTTAATPQQQQQQQQTTASAPEQPADTQTQTTAANNTSSTVNTNTNANANASNVNSQARVNTQTHPTTATQTRSTPRPHVHLAQHSVQGFDPFLPCNSHHIRHRRRVPGTFSRSTAAASTATTAQAPPAGEQQSNERARNSVYNLVQGLMRNFENRQRERPAEQETINTGSTTATPAPTQSTDDNASWQAFESLFGPFDVNQMLREGISTGENPTLSTFFQNFSNQEYAAGCSLFADLVMTFAQSLTLRDIAALSAGQIEPMLRNRPALRSYIRTRVLEGEYPTQAAFTRGANRFITELQPMFDLLGSLRVRDNIDLIESVKQLCRNRFPNLISLVMSAEAGSFRTLISQCILTLRHFCALVLYASVDGPGSVEHIFQAFIANYVAGVSPDIYNWTLSTSLAQLRTFLETLDIPRDDIQAYIVTRSTNTSRQETTTITQTAETEPMEMDCEENIVTNTAVEPTTLPVLNTESLPNVVIGSEPWHRGISEDWIPIITRDNQRQRRQNPQPPFSDAYLSGMPNKRRKIVAASKPQGNLPQVISDGVRKAVTTTGLTPAAPLDVVTQAASTDLTLQTAYRDSLRSNVQADLQNNPDFTSERFPNASTYFDAE